MKRFHVHVPVDDLGELGRLAEGVNNLADGIREREALRELFNRQVGQAGDARLMLLAALQGRRDRTLLWMSGALLLGGAGFVVSTARGIPDWRDPVIVLSNMLLITGYACILTSLRSYVGRPMRVWALLAGAAVWFALCLWPWFLASDAARLLVFSLLSIAYLAAAGRTLWPERRARRSTA